MLERNWKNLTISLLQNKLGLSTNVIIEDVVNSLDLNEKTINTMQYNDLVIRVGRLIPVNIK